MDRSVTSRLFLPLAGLLLWSPACEPPAEDGGAASTETAGQAATLLPQTVSPAGQSLLFRLSGPLKQPGCAGDYMDADCLADDQERALAMIVNPLHFLDEGEDCPDQEKFYQVRPIGVSSKFQYGPQDLRFVASSDLSVDNWRPWGGTYYVQLTYFLNFIKDCNAWGGHLGDNEHVTYLFSSSDLTNWRLEQGHYPAHGFPEGGPRGGKGFFYSGLYIANIAREIRLNLPVVASDEDGHGSYPGLSSYSASCAGNDMYGLNGDGNLRDCFHDDGIWDDGHLGSALAHGRVGRVLTAQNDWRNIGEPGAWNRGVLNVSADGQTASYMRNGASETFSAGSRFCGWNCASRFLPGGDCSPFHVCSDPMWDKIDRSCFFARGSYRGLCFRNLPRF